MKRQSHVIGHQTVDGLPFCSLAPDITPFSSVARPTRSHQHQQASAGRAHTTRAPAKPPSTTTGTTGQGPACPPQQLLRPRGPVVCEVGCTRTVLTPARSCLVFGLDDGFEMRSLVRVNNYTITPPVVNPPFLHQGHNCRENYTHTEIKNTQTAQKHTD